MNDKCWGTWDVSVMLVLLLYFFFLQTMLCFDIKMFTCVQSKMGIILGLGSVNLCS